MQSLSLSAIPLSVHEQAMQLAIVAARANPFFPFGAVIVRAADREVMATGANNRRANPTLHGEHSVILTFPVAALGTVQTPDPVSRCTWHNAGLTCDYCSPHTTTPRSASAVHDK